MPRYDDVPKDEQLPRTRTTAPPAPPAPAAAAPAAELAEEAWVAITTTVPVSVRKQMSVACAIHGVKLKDAVTEALRAWLADHPPRLD
ncbi:hypothetical protein GCM10009678_86280 [Actinomadura kijaniata]|uniref:ParG n=1 Tax=Actinomadura namibiensis TaxID=182080 RepID=A0A7W3QST8_ACTNM|nr:hypothetical protein [Actinomadura namibiensis]MBA8957718.1 hypothetical protein [Actinomadura namibiensis]